MNLHQPPQGIRLEESAHGNAMAKTAKKPATRLYPIGTRFSAAEKAALEKCAAKDDRPVTVMMRKIVADYLREHGYLK